MLFKCADLVISLLEGFLELYSLIFKPFDLVFERLNSILMWLPLLLEPLRLLYCIITLSRQCLDLHLHVPIRLLLWAIPCWIQIRPCMYSWNRGRTGRHLPWTSALSPHSQDSTSHLTDFLAQSCRWGSELLNVLACLGVGPLGCHCVLRHDIGVFDPRPSVRARRQQVRWVKLYQWLLECLMLLVVDLLGAIVVITGLGPCGLEAWVKSYVLTLAGDFKKVFGLRGGYSERVLVFRCIDQGRVILWWIIIFIKDVRMLVLSVWR